MSNQNKFITVQINNRYATLNEKLFHRQPAKPLLNPRPGHFNQPLAVQLNCLPEFEQDWVRIIGGEQLPVGFDPLAMVYAGHQFGQWAGQLGDGRGLLLAQLVDQHGQTQDLHLKGAGHTPYSRMGDGRAVLRSVIREYLAGHALNALGVASSNALGFVTSDTPVQRETLEQGACLLRVADSHIRLGHFEWINRYQPDLLKDFTDKVIEWHYPDCLKEENPVLSFAGEVIDRTAKTIADWQLFGFAHGVMNTDNLSITGSTLDFGPYGFLERFNPAWINNHSDHSGRYTYQNQPSMAHWNLWVWLGQLLPLGVSKEDLQAALGNFEPAFLHYYGVGMAKKLGLPVEHADTFNLGMDFLRILQQEKLDYSGSFLRLSHESEWQGLRDDCIYTDQFDVFISKYQQVLQQVGQDVDSAARLQQMQQANPVYILRNHMAQQAIEQAEQGDFSEVERLFNLLANPFTKQPGLEKTTDLAPLAGDQAEVSVSCSS